MTGKPIFPLQQGALDYLCSVYAAINLAYLHGKINDLPQAKNMFDGLITAVGKAKGGNLAAYVKAGIDPGADFTWALDQAGFDSRKSSGASLPNILELLQKSGEPVCVYAEGKSNGNNEIPFTHFTVITGVHPNGNLALFDSYGFTEIVKVDGSLWLGDEEICITAIWEVSPRTK